MKYRYTGGMHDLSVVLADTVVDVNPGDVVDVTGDDAERLAAHPEFDKVKGRGSSSRRRRPPSSELAAGDDQADPDPDPDPKD